MARIKLYDGTRTPQAGLVLKRALQELANFQRVEVSPSPGAVDVQGFNFVQGAVARVGRRGRVHLGDFLTYIHGLPELRNQPERVVIVEPDLFADGLNWCFGGHTKHAGTDYVVLSTKRVRDYTHLFHLFAHELGHMYGAAPPGRRNTIELLGSHCVNNNCVMQQQVTIEDSVLYAHARARSGAPVYCGQCQVDLRRYSKGHE
ncbi:hypothetical protein HY489_05545 [Candidatus Woesearchaeota archaeon]|nr:hypothetical protein [Candidatus Woesearchaeota archaeon]